MKVVYSKIKNTLTCTITTKNGNKVVGVGINKNEACLNAKEKLKGVR